MTDVAANEDSDPDVVRFILEHIKSSSSHSGVTSFVNYRRTGKTMKWKCFNFVSKSSIRVEVDS